MTMNLLTVITMIIIIVIIMSIILLTRKVNLIMSLGILAGLVIHITVIWLIDMVIIIIIINRPWQAGPGWIVGMIHF